MHFKRLSCTHNYRERKRHRKQGLSGTLVGNQVQLRRTGRSSFSPSLRTLRLTNSARTRPPTEKDRIVHEHYSQNTYIRTSQDKRHTQAAYQQPESSIGGLSRSIGRSRRRRRRRSRGIRALRNFHVHLLARGRYGTVREAVLAAVGVQLG